MFKKTLILMLVVILILPIFLSAAPGTASADDGLITTIDKYPGPFGPYEKDIVTVACAQIEPIYSDTKANLEKMKQFVTRAAEKGANIILFSELVLNTPKAGASTEEALNLAELFPGPSSQEMAKLTQKLGVYVVYGFWEKNPDPTKRRYNSAAIIGPNGIIGEYRKIHPAVEDADRGYTPVAFKTPWGPVGISICQDAYSHPELARTHAMMGARLMLVPSRSAMGGGQEVMLPEQIMSRAVENLFYVAMCNAVGYKEPNLYWGGSLICGNSEINYRPTVFARGSDKEELIIATIDLKNSDRFRRLGGYFEPHVRLKEPLVLPQMWADIWGSIGGKPTQAELEKQLTAKNQELEALKLEENAQRVQAQQNFYIVTAVAGLLLLSTIALSVIAFRKRRK